MYLLYLAAPAVCSDYFNVSSTILPRIALILEIHPASPQILLTIHLVQDDVLRCFMLRTVSAKMSGTFDLTWM